MYNALLSFISAPFGSALLQDNVSEDDGVVGQAPITSQQVLSTTSTTTTTFTTAAAASTTQASGVSMVAVDLQSAAFAQAISRTARPYLPQSSLAGDPQSLGSVTVIENSTLQDGNVPAAEEQSGGFFSMIISGVKNAIGNAGNAAATYGKFIYEDAIVPGGAYLALLGESSNTEVNLPEDASCLMAQLDPEEKLLAKCHLFGQTVAPFVAKSLIGEQCSQTIVDGLAVYLGRISYKILACLAAAAVPAKSKKSVYDEFVDLAKAEGYTDYDDGWHPAYCSYLAGAISTNSSEFAEENQDVFDLASRTIFDLVEKHLGSVFDFFEQIESYVNISEVNEADKAFKAARKAELLESLNPLIEEVLKLCHLTSIEDLGFADGLTWAIKQGVGYKAKGSGKTDWEYAIEAIKESLFEYHCKVLVDRKSKITESPSETADKLVLPEKVNNILQEFLQGALERECSNAKEPLSLPKEVQRKLRRVRQPSGKEVDPQNRLPHICQRVSDAIAGKFIEGVAKSLSDYCSARTLLCLEKFLSLYIYKVMYKALAHLATSPVACSMPQQDLWLNITTSLVDIANKHYGLIRTFAIGENFTASLKEVVAQYDALPEISEEEKNIKEAAYKAICDHCAPIVEDLLQTCGLKDIEDLQLSSAVGNLLKTAALAGTREKAWDLVREILQKGLIALVRIGPELEPSLEGECPTMVSLARSGAKDGGPAILQALVGVSESIGQSLEKLLEYHGWNIVDARSIERIFEAVLSGKDPVFSRFQRQFGDFLSPRVYGILAQAASFSPNKGAKDADHLQAANVLAKIVANVCEVMRNNVQGRHERFQKVAAIYETHELLLHTLYAAKRHFDQMEKCREVQQWIQGESPADISMERYWVEGIHEQIDIQCWKILEAAQCADKVTKVASAARRLFGEIDDLKDDIEVIKAALFGTHEPGRFDHLLRNCKANYAIVEASCDRILAEHFTDLAVDALAMTGIDHDEITRIPGLAALLDPKRGTAMQWLMLKAYNELAAPQQATGYNVQLEEMLFGPPKVSLNALKELAEVYPDNQGLQKALKERNKTARAIEFFENTCAVFAQDIRSRILNYLQEDAEEIVNVINSCLAEKLTPEAAALMREGFHELAEESCPSVKSAFDYMEELLSGGLFKLLVKIGKVQVGKSKKVTNEEMMSAILLQIFEIIEGHKEKIAVRMEKWHLLPEESEEDKNLRQMILRKIFKDVAKDLLGLIGANPLKDIVPPFLENSLEKALCEKLLPDLLGKMYCEATVLERKKKFNEKLLQSLFKNPDNPQKGSKVPQQAMSAFAQYAAQAAPSYLALNSGATAKTVLDSLSKHLAEAGPAGRQAAAYLAGNKRIGPMLERNIHLLAMSKEQLGSTWDSVQEFVESILLQALGNLSGEITLLENGKSQLLQSTILQLLQLVAIHVEQLDHVRKAHKKTYTYEVEPVDLLKGLAGQSVSPSDNPAFEKQYLEAKEELDKAQKELQKLKDSRLSLVKQFKSHLGEFLGANFRRSLKAKMEEIERSLGPAYAKRAEKQKIFDAVRKKRCFLPIAKDLLNLMNFKSADDLPFPSALKKQLWDLLRHEILPEALQSVYDTLLDKNVLDSMLISALQSLDTAATDASFGKEDSNARTLEQVEFDTALGKAVVVFIQNFPSMFSRSILNLDYINKMAVDAIGQKLRIILSEQTLIQMLHQGLFSGIESLVPKGKWEVDVLGGGQHVLKQNGSTKLDFGLPMTDKEKRRADRRRAAEGVANAAKVHKLVGQATSKQIKAMIASKIKAGWDAFQVAFDRSIAKHCGGIDGWGMQIKRFFDMVFRALFVEVIGTLLYYVCWPLYKIVELIFDAICEAFGERFQKSLHAGFNDALVFGGSKKFFAILNDLKADREQGLRG